MHGVVRGAMSLVQGGKFLANFASGFVSSAFSIGRKTFGEGAVAARTAVMALVGGVTSSLTGGKFLNGAVSAAFVHLFNAEMKTIHRGSYKNGASILDKMKDGDIVFAKRDLGDIALVQEPLLDIANNEIAHEHIFYKYNGKLYNIGFSSGEWLRNENKFNFYFSDIYSVSDIEYVISVQKNFNPNDYNILTLNCQTFADAVATRIRYNQGYGSDGARIKYNQGYGEY